MIKSSIKIILVLTCVLFISSSCTDGKGEGFQIYLTKEDVPPLQMEDLSHTDLEDLPVISTEDIITYDAQSHEIKLKDDVFERICQLDIPMGGTSFVVCVDKTPIYWGGFWTPISSYLFEGITILQPFFTQESRVITLELGYPSSSYYGGEDPRNNSEVVESLNQAGVLINKL